MSPLQRQVLQIHDKILGDEKSGLFRALEKAVTDSGEAPEGNLFFYNKSTTFSESPNRRCNLIRLARESTHMLEIGFNAGHSSALALLANPSLRVTAVDICTHKYVEPCAKILRTRFGSRFTLRKGDSRRVLSSLPTPHGFDLLHIDGCHRPVVANLDMYHSLRYSKGPGTIVILDDVQKAHLSSLWVYYTKTTGILQNKLDVFPSDFTVNAAHAIGILASKDRLGELLSVKQKEIEEGLRRKRGRGEKR